MTWTVWTFLVSGRVEGKEKPSLEHIQYRNCLNTVHLGKRDGTKGKNNWIDMGSIGTVNMEGVLIYIFVLYYNIITSICIYIYCTYTNKTWWSIHTLDDVHTIYYSSPFPLLSTSCTSTENPDGVIPTATDQCPGPYTTKKTRRNQQIQQQRIKSSQECLKTIYTKIIKHQNIERESFQAPLQHISLNSRESRWNTLLIVLPSFILVPTLNTKKSEEKHEFIWKMLDCYIYLYI